MKWDILVKDLRKKMLLSQEEMADELEVAFSTVNRYENKKVEPTFKVQRKLRNLAIKNGLNFESYRG